MDAGTIGSIAALSTFAKNLVDLARQGKSADVQGRLVEGLIEIQLQALDARNEYDDMRRERDDLRKRLDLRGEVSAPVNGVIFYRDQEQPYCGACWGDREKLIPLINHGNSYYSHSCPSCKVTIPKTGALLDAAREYGRKQREQEALRPRPTSSWLGRLR